MSKNDYDSLYKRNWPIISLNDQKKISELCVAVAGCGSTGGAFVDGLARVGIQNFHLSDNGNYELHNLNRQMVFREDLGKNKAQVQAERILKINPSSKVKTWDAGLSINNFDEFLDGIDFLFDAVDVTTVDGMKTKLELHKAAFDRKIPTGSALDLGYKQWLQSFNYHLGEKLLKGRFEAAKSCKHPLKAIIAGFSPVEDLTLEIAEELLRLVKNPNEGACQLGSACFLLSAMATPYILEFVNDGKLPDLIQIDIMEFFKKDADRNKTKQKVLNNVTEVLRQLN